jgi:hypothetical protein
MMVGTKEYITHEKGNNEAWICPCGNMPTSDGFYPCNKNGKEMVPEAGLDNLYVCARCGRIIDQGSLEILDRNLSFKRLD